MFNIILAFKKVHGVFHVPFVFFCLAYMSFTYTQTYTPVNIAPLYRDAIKAVDPLEILKKGVGSPSDRAEY